MSCNSRCLRGCRHYLCSRGRCWRRTTCRSCRRPPQRSESLLSQPSNSPPEESTSLARPAPGVCWDSCCTHSGAVFYLSTFIQQHGGDRMTLRKWSQPQSFARVVHSLRCPVFIIILQGNQNELKPDLQRNMGPSFTRSKCRNILRNVLVWLCGELQTNSKHRSSFAYFFLFCDDFGSLETDLELCVY